MNLTIFFITQIKGGWNLYLNIIHINCSLQRDEFIDLFWYITIDIILCLSNVKLKKFRNLVLWKIQNHSLENVLIVECKYFN